MDTYEPKTFSVPAIDGISEKTITTHLGLYEGYVTNLNAHYKQLEVLGTGGDPLVTSAIRRRIQFELSGVINHEQYFGALEHGSSDCTDGSSFHTAVSKQFGSFESFINHIKAVGTSMRGIGWIIAVYDSSRSTVHTLWVTDHELSNVNLPAFLAVDMWEHSYMIDYAPKDKGKYLDAYLAAVNWKFVEERFASIQ
ncbi:MAG: hypothetical protein OYG31_00580 [Candidatus Kaiserbacteria bacterium]|nr:hypothetical protein [Candidatus Kaiserbacteria bacterium]